MLGVGNDLVEWGRIPLLGVAGVNDARGIIVEGPESEKAAFSFGEGGAEKPGTSHSEAVALLADIAPVVTQEDGLQGDAKLNELFIRGGGTLGMPPSGYGKI